MITIDALEKQLKDNKITSSLYLFYGQELYLMDTIVKKIRGNFGELMKGINDITIDEENLQELIPNIETPTFGFERKFILVKNTGLFKKDTKRKNAKLQEIKEKLTNYIQENIEFIQQGCMVIFIEESVDKGKLVDIFEKYGVVCQFDFQKPAQLVKRIKGITNAYKVNVDEATITYFLECVGTNMQEIINEIRKLIEYSGQGGTITRELIDLLCIKQIDSVIFDLTDGLGKRDIGSAIQVLNNLLYAKEPIQKIFITLYNHFKKLYIIKLATKYNRDIAESLNLKANQMFLISKYKKQSGYFKEEELREILEKMIELDTNYKIGLIDINVGLETILATYCS